MHGGSILTIKWLLVKFAFWNGRKWKLGRLTCRSPECWHKLESEHSTRGMHMHSGHVNSLCATLRSSVSKKTFVSKVKPFCMKDRIGGGRVRWQKSDYNLPFLKIVSQSCHAYYRHHSDWLDLRLHLPGTILRFVVSVSMIPIEEHEMILNNWKFSLQTHGQLKNKQDTKTNTKLFCNHLESPEGFKRMTMPCG